MSLFPFDTTLFAGKISGERTPDERPLELTRREGRSLAELSQGHADAGKMG